MRPKLQIALDVLSIDAAKEILTSEVVRDIDIIEVGTLLLASEGKKAVQEIRKYIGEDKLLVADFKIADGAAVMAEMFFDMGADLTTVIAAANKVSMKKAHDIAQCVGKQIQIELYGVWDYKMAQSWYDIGIRHVIFHHARDGKHMWNEEDVAKVKTLCEMGFCVSVTGGISEEVINLFRGIPVYAFIVGRSFYQSDNIIKTISRYQKAIDDYHIESL